MNWTRLFCVAALAIATLALSSCSLHKRTPKSSTKPSAQSSTPKPNNAGESNIKKKYAAELGVAPQDLKNEKLYVFIDEWKGVPYKYGGTTKTGIDCSGFIGILYREVYSINLPRTTSEISQNSKPISKSNLNEGDIVIFDINGKKGSHVGVYLINGKFVHASTSKGVIISDLENPYYQKAFSRGGKI